MNTPRAQLRLASVGLLAAVLFQGPACQCGGKYQTHTADGGVSSDGYNTLTITPLDKVVTVPPGGPAATIGYQATASGPRGTDDVTKDTIWKIDDTGLGTFKGATFTTSTSRGGKSTVRASYGTLTASTSVTVEMPINDTQHCPGCPPFPPPGTPACSGSSSSPGLVYPPDGVLLPPNMNVIEVHFTPGVGNDIFEVDFQNAGTDIRVETLCNPVKNSRGVATGGCAYALDAFIWDALAQSNRGGEPVTVKVRGAPTSGTCISSSAERKIAFATEDINGGLYYWQSAVYGGVAGRTGGIFRYDFGVRGAVGSPYLTPSAFNGGRCVGCHVLSRDGQRMTYGDDDPDSDDEYGDLFGHVIDVGTKAPIGLPFAPGFQSFNSDHTRFIASDGLRVTTPPGMYLQDAMAGGLVKVLDVRGSRATHGDWAPDDKSVVLVVPNFRWKAKWGDDHFTDGAIYTMGFDLSANTLGVPSLLVPAGGANNYYPSYSPDGRFVIFNRASGVDPSGFADAFNNPDAKVFAVPATGGTAVELKTLDKGPSLTNSWPRWSPFIQQHNGKKLLWVTFSSTRDYGLRVQNENNNLIQCYPPDSPQSPNGTHGQPLSPDCNQPQIWMAAVYVENEGLGAGIDTSFEAFWLPFQDQSSHNHIPQWTETIVRTHDDGGTTCTQNADCPPSQICVAGHCVPNDGDGGVCKPAGASCVQGSGPMCCDPYTCLQDTDGGYVCKLFG
jgi:hypothetical protein